MSAPPEGGAPTASTPATANSNLSQPGTDSHTGGEIVMTVASESAGAQPQNKSTAPAPIVTQPEVDTVADTTSSSANVEPAEQQTLDKPAEIVALSEDKVEQPPAPKDSGIQQRQNKRTAADAQLTDSDLMPPPSVRKSPTQHRSTLAVGDDSKTLYSTQTEPAAPLGGLKRKRGRNNVHSTSALRKSTSGKIPARTEHTRPSSTYSMRPEESTDINPSHNDEQPRTPIPLDAHGRYVNVVDGKTAIQGRRHEMKDSFQHFSSRKREKDAAMMAKEGLEPVSKETSPDNVSSTSKRDKGAKKKSGSKAKAVISRDDSSEDDEGTPLTQRRLKAAADKIKHKREKRSKQKERKAKSPSPQPSPSSTQGGEDEYVDKELVEKMTNWLEADDSEDESTLSRVKKEPDNDKKADTSDSGSEDGLAPSSQSRSRKPLISSDNDDTTLNTLRTPATKAGGKRTATSSSGRSRKKDPLIRSKADKRAILGYLKSASLDITKQPGTSRSYARPRKSKDNASSQTSAAARSNAWSSKISATNRPSWPASSALTRERSNNLVSKLGELIDGVKPPKEGVIKFRDLINCLKNPNTCKQYKDGIIEGRPSQQGWASNRHLAREFPDWFDSHGLRTTSFLNDISPEHWEQMGLPYVFLRPYTSENNLFQPGETPQNLLQEYGSQPVNLVSEDEQETPVKRKQHKKSSSTSTKAPATPALSRASSVKDVSSEVKSEKQTQREDAATMQQDSGDLHSPPPTLNSDQERLRNVESIVQRIESRQRDDLERNQQRPSRFLSEEDIFRYHGLMTDRLRSIHESVRNDDLLVTLQQIALLARTHNDFDNIVRTHNDLPSLDPQARTNHDLLNAPNSLNEYINDVARSRGVMVDLPQPTSNYSPYVQQHQNGYMAYPGSSAQPQVNDSQSRYTLASYGINVFEGEPIQLENPLTSHTHQPPNQAEMMQQGANGFEDQPPQFITINDQPQDNLANAFTGNRTIEEILDQDEDQDKDDDDEDEDDDEQ